MDNYYYTYIFLSIFFFLATVLFIKASSKTRLKLPPGPPAWPIIGNLFGLNAEKPHIWLANLAREHGPLFSLRLGFRVLVMASSPETAKEVLKTRDRDLSGRFKSRLIGSLPEFQSSVIVLSTECGEKWRSLRKNAHVELFSHGALESHTKIRVQKAQEMMDFLAKQEGEVVEIVNVAYATAVNILTNTLMSEDLIRSLDFAVGEMKKFSRMLIGFVIPTIADLYPLIGGFLDGGYTRIVGMEYKEKSKALWGEVVEASSGGSVEELGLTGGKSTCGDNGGNGSTAE
ncbi:OLC1v1005231C1 [Oldenlandia corymbosa var. corymbosa]|uniref:OLC1v1005231C1 n=1 Tax=Oldenlandia corymbosa var. corymbosa TaxID=529605 RepID=A0AAV1DGK1_OLDCO|nr:OLC1v1005231C1 [Oldenlandia corymbosa var. corymbosa]